MRVTVLDRSPASVPEAGPVLVLRPSRGWVRLGLNDLWERRELLYFPSS